jgi:hypothetical protein
MRPHLEIVIIQYVYFDLFAKFNFYELLLFAVYVKICNVIKVS